jgi:hypothetical protein
LARGVKLTFQITGSVSLGLWAVLMFFPIQYGGRYSLLELVLNPGHTNYSGQAFIMTGILVGYGVLALVLASSRD